MLVIEQVKIVKSVGIGLADSKVTISIFEL